MTGTFGKHAAVDFQMPAICSPLVRPGRPAETACVVSEQLSNILIRLMTWPSSADLLYFEIIDRAELWRGASTDSIQLQVMEWKE